MSNKRYYNEESNENNQTLYSSVTNGMASRRPFESQQVYQEYVGEYFSRSQDEAFYQLKPKVSIPKQPQIKSVTSLQQSKARLPKNRFKVFIVWTLLFFTAVITASFMMPNHYVNYVVVEGNQVTDSASIIQASGVKFWDKYGEIKVNQKKIAEAIIKENPRVSNVEISRYHDYGVQIKVEEHIVVAKINLNGRLVPVLDNGEKLLDNHSQYQVFDLDKYPEIILSKPDDAVEVTQVLKDTPQHILDQIDAIQYHKKETKENAIELWMKDGNIVKAILPTFNQKMTYYAKMLEELSGKKGTINLEVGAYFSPSQEDIRPVKLQSGH